MPTTNILLATLGGTWQVIPEVVAALAPDRCSLYEHHPQPALLNNIRAQCGISTIDELWVITSDSKRTRTGLKQLQAWNAVLAKPFVLRFFIAEGTDEVTSPEELALLRELIFRTALLATETGALVCSLAGGRKTMSADLQRAASLFGSRGLLHIVGPEPLPDDLKSDEVGFWASSLTSIIARQLMPAFVGRYSRRETMDTLWADNTAVSSLRFPIPVASRSLQHISAHYFSDDGLSLVNEAEQREQDAQQLLSNYLAQIATTEKHENWRHLYRLAPADIEHLRSTMLDESHRDLIRQLPKAELHCHLGGLPNLDAQKGIGAAIWAAMNADQRNGAVQAVADLLSQQSWPWEWPSTFLSRQLAPVARAERAAALLVNATELQLQHNLYTVTESRIALRESDYGFAVYERPGELTGSSVLGHPAALPPYVATIRAYTCSESIRYLELRGSPHKYSDDPVAWLRELRSYLADDLSCSYRFIWIIDRRYKNIGTTVEQAVRASQDENLKKFLVGLDVAGDENATKPQALSPDFLPAFEHCLPVTIHAGEGESAENIWQAAYHLHADRIGHGLTLANHPELLQRFRNRGICLELCPSSNREVIGYCDPAFPHSINQPHYPLLQLWNSGVALTINTDNSGISRTTLTNEFIAAARMTEYGISLWDCLALIKQAFVHAMASAEDREALLKQYDGEIFRLVSTWLQQRLLSLPHSSPHGAPEHNHA